MTLHHRPKRLHHAACSLISYLVLGLFFVGSAFGKDNPTITQFGHTIVVSEGQKTGDVTCLGCSIYVRGGVVAGDVTALAGSIVVEDQSQISGDVTTVAGNVRVGKSVSIAGDLTAVGGHVRRDPDSQIAGDVTSLGSGGWMLLIFGFPLILLGALVALIVWLVQRSRQPAPAAT
jgi:hypothetical protein